MRALLLFVIGLLFGTAGGYLAGGGLGQSPQHDHAAHTDAAHTHENTTVWSGPAPELNLVLSRDTGTNLNLQIAVEGFDFSPQSVNGEIAPGQGHAHIYVNETKVARAYGPWMHLTDVPPKAAIRVTLNANDHSVWTLDGQPIAAQVTAP